jgi:hypothetical protein
LNGNIIIIDKIELTSVQVPEKSPVGNGLLVLLLSPTLPNFYKRRNGEELPYNAFSFEASNPNDVPIMFENLVVTTSQTSVIISRIYYIMFTSH